MLAEVPMVDPKLYVNLLRKRSEEDDENVEDTWQWWNKFRTYADYNPKIKVSEIRTIFFNQQEVFAVKHFVMMSG